MIFKTLCCVLLLGIPVSSAAQEESAAIPPLQELLAPDQYRKYISKTKYKDRIDILRKTMESYGSMLRRHLDRKDLNEVKQALTRLRALTHYAQEEPTRSAASQKDLRSKQIKKMEILLRRQLDTLNDMKLSVPFDFRPEFEETTEAFERLRDQLLRGLFYQSGS
jgi:hypothetical protein